MSIWNCGNFFQVFSSLRYGIWKLSGCKNFHQHGTTLTICRLSSTWNNLNHMQKCLLMYSEIFFHARRIWIKLGRLTTTLSLNQHSKDFKLYYWDFQSCITKLYCLRNMQIYSFCKWCKFLKSHSWLFWEWNQWRDYYSFGIKSSIYTMKEWKEVEASKKYKD
jgi:hypothetical protein